MTRRDLLTAAGSAALLSPFAALAATDSIPNPKGHLGLGGAPTGFGARNGGGRGPVVAAVPVVAQVGEQALPVRRQRVAGAVRAVPFPMNFSTIATAWVWAWRNWARLPPIPTICAGCATRWRPTTCG